MNYYWMILLLMNHFFGSTLVYARKLYNNLEMDLKAFISVLYLMIKRIIIKIILVLRFVFGMWVVDCNRCSREGFFVFDSC